MREKPDDHKSAAANHFIERAEERLPSPETAIKQQDAILPKVEHLSSAKPFENCTPDTGSRSASPFSSSASPFFRMRNSSASSIDSGASLTRSRGPRISKEDVQQRLIKKRSMESPLRESVSSREDLKSQENSAAENFDEPDLMDTDNAPLDSMFSRRSSVEAMQSSTDVSTDVELKDVIIESVEKKRLVSLESGNNQTRQGLVSSEPGSTPVSEAKQFVNASGAFEGLRFDLSADPFFGQLETDHLGDMRSALDRLVQDVACSSNSTSRYPGPDQRRLKIEAVTEGVKAGTFKPPPISLDEDMVADVEFEEQETKLNELAIGKRPVEFPAVVAAVDLPPLPPKDAIATREKIILEKRREARRQEEEEAMGFITPPRKTGRPRRRRSLSTGDAENISKKSATTRKRRTILQRGIDDGSLDVAPFVETEVPLSDSIDRELRKLEGSRGVSDVTSTICSSDPYFNQKYHVREHETTIYASLDGDRVSHMPGAGDLNSGRAWKPVRRPSDMVSLDFRLPLWTQFSLTLSYKERAFETN
jgi:hypothetical protein